MLFDALKEAEIDFAVDRWTACAGRDGRARYDWRPIGLFRAPNLDEAIHKAAIVVNRPALLRAIPVEIAPLPNERPNEQLGFEFK